MASNHFINRPQHGDSVGEVGRRYSQTESVSYPGHFLIKLVRLSASSALEGIFTSGEGVPERNRPCDGVGVVPPRRSAIEIRGFAKH